MTLVLRRPESLIFGLRVPLDSIDSDCPYDSEDHESTGNNGKANDIEEKSKDIDYPPLSGDEVSGSFNSKRCALGIYQRNFRF